MTEITYTRQGDYNLPNLLPPQEEPVPHGKYALLRKKFLKEHRRVTYTNLLTSGKLNSHLAEIQQTAQRRMEQIVAQMAKAQGVTEELKASDQMKWVGLMNNLQNAAEEMVLAELIYSYRPKSRNRKKAQVANSSLRFWMKSRSWPSSPTRMMT